MAGNVTHLSIALLLIVLVIIGALIYARRKMKISFGLVGLGALAFVLAVNILERLVHSLVLQPNPDASISLIRKAPGVYVLYACLMAAIFEEGARYLVFYWLGKKRSLRLTDGLAYGLGHGGAELFLVGWVTFLLYLLVYLTGPSAKLPPIIAYQAWSLSPLSIYLGLLERLLAFALQICLSFWVYYALEKKKISYFFWALVFHALCDLPAALGQVGLLGNIWLLEGSLGLCLLVLIFLTRKYIIGPTLGGEKIGN
ncbi:YhfC family intramembrane metalloprotease [Streptococcus oricebi]|uniref:YhfC family intramembrane metalloprotease n=1 Tax=Streptococcus oricebi TaxID=1547447 RepID=A0ABS5B3A4_9STRE|nr:YhfC family glutamic-type intramembrane protease [Streptococcus oricebi]MBP2623312.1 YhfC family intramembrane metalloprotease [Streptococcus oricebi]